MELPWSQSMDLEFDLNSVDVVAGAGVRSGRVERQGWPAAADRGRPMHFTVLKVVKYGAYDDA